MSNRNANWDNSQRQCTQCGCGYIPNTIWQMTCSYECGYKKQNAKKPKAVNNGLCKRCNATLIHKKNHAIYCSQLCKSLDFNFHHRYKSRLTSKSRRMAIIERDKWTCYVCDQILTFEQIELDHLIPHSRNGSSDSTNLAVSCLPCNRSRSNTIGIRQLEKLFELRSEL